MAAVTPEQFSNFPVDIETLPKVETVKLKPISKKYLVKLQLNSALSFLFFGIGLIVAYSYLSPEFTVYIQLGGVLLLLLFGWFLYNNFKYVQKSGYAIRERDIIFQRGFIFQRTTAVPFNRIQHVTVERSFLDKLLNIATIKIFTAGGSGSDISVPGISPETATSVKEEISGRIFDHA